jgi:hypothetical protein
MTQQFGVVPPVMKTKEDFEPVSAEDPENLETF